MKNCNNCEFYINNACCGRNDIYGKKLDTPIENCKEWEESFKSLQERKGGINAAIEKIIDG